jgi:hypothetical protein
MRRAGPARIRTVRVITALDRPRPLREARVIVKATNGDPSKRVTIEALTSSSCSTATTDASSIGVP